MAATAQRAGTSQAGKLPAGLQQLHPELEEAMKVGGSVEGLTSYCLLQSAGGAVRTRRGISVNGARITAITALSPGLGFACADQMREDADRYISGFLRKAGGWSKWQRTCKQGQQRRLGALSSGATAAGPVAAMRHRGQDGGVGGRVGGGVGGVSGALAAVLQGTHLVEQRVVEEDGDECEGGVGMGGDGGVGMEGDDDDYMYELEDEDAAQEGVAAMAAAAGLVEW